MKGELYFKDGHIEEASCVVIDGASSMSFNTKKNRYQYFVYLGENDGGFYEAKGTFYKYIKGINRWTEDKTIKGIKLEVTK